MMISETKINSRECPLCRSIGGPVLRSFDVEDAARHFSSKGKDRVRHEKLSEHIKSLWRADTADIVRCDACDFVFSSPYTAGDSTFYGLAYDHANGAYPDAKWEFSRTVLEIERKLPLPSGRLLEVGAGDGAFLRQVAPRFFHPMNVLCSEFSDYGKRRIGADGFDVYDRDIRELEIERGGFDVICMFQVLEHMDRLAELFECLHRLGSNRSELYIAVPNDQYIDFIEGHGGLMDMPPNHIGRWNRKSFEELLSFGWELVNHEYEPGNLRTLSSGLATSRYFRKRQSAWSMASLADRLPAPRVRRAAQIGLVGLSLPRSIVSSWTSRSEGGSQWAHLRRIA